MPTFHLQLRNVPPNAEAVDVRRFFSQFNIPHGGVQMVGGREGHAFVTFSNSDDLLKGTLHNKHFMMGRQMEVGLVNSDDIKRIIAEVKHERSAQRRPVGRAPVHQGPHGPAPGFHAPRQLAPHSDDGQWLRQQDAAARSWSPQYGSTYKGQGAKKVRLDTHGHGGEMSFNRWAASSGRDAMGRQEEIQMELEIEEKITRNMMEQLKQRTEKIKTLRQGVQTGPTDERWYGYSAPQSHHPPPPARQYPGAKRYPGPGLNQSQSAPNTVGNRAHPVQHGPRQYYRDQRPGLKSQPPPQAGYSGHYAGNNRRGAMHPGPSHYHEGQTPTMDNKELKSNTPSNQAGQSTKRKRTRGAKKQHVKKSKPTTSEVPPAPKAVKSKAVPFASHAAKSKSSKSKSASKVHSSSASVKEQSPVPSVFFLTLSVQEDSSASGVWDKFGGVRGRSVGVILLEVKEDVAQKSAFVAYENIDDSRANVGLHPDACCSSDKDVYTRLANAPPGSNIYKTNPTGEDVELSDNEKALLNQEYLLQGSVTLPSCKIEKSHQIMLNKISTALFNVRSRGKKQQGSRQRSSTDPSQLSYLRLKSLSKDISACEVWAWFGGAEGPCAHVTLTYRLDEKQENIKMAYVAFKDPQSRFEESNKRSGSESLTEKEVLAHLARAGTHREIEIVRSTNTGVDAIMTAEEKVALAKVFYVQGLPEDMQEKMLKTRADVAAPQAHTVSDPVKPSTSRTDNNMRLYYVALHLQDEGTASGVWDRFGGSFGRSLGVLLLDSGDDDVEKIAFVAYEDEVEQKAQLALNPGATSWSDSEVYRHCATPGSKVFKTTPMGDAEISEGEKALLNQEFLKSYTLNQVEKDDDLMKINSISKSLFYVDGKEEQQEILPSQGDSVWDGEGETCYLRIEFIPCDATACQVWSWMGGAAGPCPHVILTRKGTPPKTISVAHVAFRDNLSRNEQKKKYAGSKVATVEGALRRIARVAADPEVEVFRSTESGTDRVFSQDEKLAMKLKWVPDEDDAGECPYVLRLRAIDRKQTSHKVWSRFGGIKGSAKGVTLMEDGDTNIAFVRFCDHEKCKEEQSKHPSSEMISENDMLKMLASCPSANRITSSSPKGNHIMSASDRAALKARFNL